MKVGLIVDTFQDSFDDISAKAREAEKAGLDGVFCYDHLWPIGHPGMPAMSCFPVLGALAAVTVRIFVGTLVARVSLYSSAHSAHSACSAHMDCDMLLHSFEAVDAIAPGRVIAGIGAGDSRSWQEDEAYGVGCSHVSERRMLVVESARKLVSEGMEVWVGSGSSRRSMFSNITVARTTGAAVNLWQADLEVAREAVSSDLPVTWAGSLERLAGGAQISPSDALAELAAAGVRWAVLGSNDVKSVAKAASLSR